MPVAEAGASRGGQLPASLDVGVGDWFANNQALARRVSFPSGRSWAGASPWRLDVGPELLAR